MKNENEEAQNMDDLVFENRNKEYGAYALRKGYSDNINKSLGLVLVSFAGVMVITLFFPGDPTIKVPKLNTHIIEFDFSTPKVEPQKPTPPAPPRRAAASHVTPTVTTAQPLTVEPPPTDDANSGDENGTDDGALTSSTPGAIPGEALTAAPVEVVTPKVVDFAEFMPQYEGGLEAMSKFIRKNLKYPAVARRMGIEGSVFVSFVIDTQGNVTETKVIKGISKECDEEAVRVISKMPAWIAGRQGNMPVMVRMVLPIKFQLNF